MDRLLVTGIPGTGKTTLGEHLAHTRGFAHFDMEDATTRSRLQDDAEAFVAGLPSPVVITWGFHPLCDVPHILHLRERGFRIVWLDGDRPAALRAFIKRNTVSEPFFYLQLWNIHTATAMQSFVVDATVNPFDVAGQFRALEDVAVEILRAAG